MKLSWSRITLIILIIVIDQRNHQHPESDKLPSLQEVENFVTAEKHLEGIPSEKEVLEKGLDLGDFDQQLLKKVEELTMYIIQLNKNVERLNKQVAEQQQTIATLHAK
ncbi:hypothetical protein [Chitinophaga polysaccharea]|uniref:hypothetical protein n=1 Tax=Chitinophaga polysaccharea TaxID=1293035 RepID=UPI0011585187|nr:hypothetical protein [Chitinophaga polysaccharea]